MILETATDSSMRVEHYLTRDFGTTVNSQTRRRLLDTISITKNPDMINLNPSRRGSAEIGTSLGRNGSEKIIWGADSSYSTIEVSSSTIKAGLVWKLITTQETSLRKQFPSTTMGTQNWFPAPSLIQVWAGVALNVSLVLRLRINFLQLEAASGLRLVVRCSKRQTCLFLATTLLESADWLHFFHYNYDNKCCLLRNLSMLFRYG